ncbi:pirin family protein [Myxococcota bacterium]|nr:pirin family protein [Myxococcota bacterium]
MSPRPVVSVITAHTQQEGGGFTVRRPFPSRGLAQLDPLLMLDEMGPVHYGPGQAIGAPDHPHRGFETVTYILDGEAEHADSSGHAGSMSPGDVQWMTAGAGVVHREMPSRRMQREGGRMHGFQLWVNLPAAEKRIAPRYQEIKAATIPSASSPDGKARVRVIAGEALGAQAVIATRTPILYHHWSLDAGADVALPLPADHRVGVYVFDGTARVSGRELHAGQLAVLGEGDHLTLSADGPAQALVLGGRPLNEPIAWSGPFVMNTEQELREAYADFRAGRLGRIPPEIVRA